jgi:hypothetical protein
MLNILQLFLTWKEQFFGKITSKLEGVEKLKSAPGEYKCQYCKETKPFSTVCNECNKPKRKD